MAIAGAAVMAPILGVQCFLARTALGWSLPQLGRAAGVASHTVRCFERGDSVRPSTVEAIQGALEKAGVIFIDANDGGPGARLAKGRFLAVADTAITERELEAARTARAVRTARADARAADLAPHHRRTTGGRRNEPAGHRSGTKSARHPYGDRARGVER
jgi:transcriptional regulator with XRE-family HTH domain